MLYKFFRWLLKRTDEFSPSNYGLYKSDPYHNLIRSTVNNVGTDSVRSTYRDASLFKIISNNNLECVTKEPKPNITKTIINNNLLNKP